MATLIVFLSANLSPAPYDDVRYYSRLWWCSGDANSDDQRMLSVEHMVEGRVRHLLSPLYIIVNLFEYRVTTYKSSAFLIAKPS